MYTFFSSEDNSSVFLFLSDKVLDMDHLDEIMTFNLVSNTSSLLLLLLLGQDQKG